MEKLLQAAQAQVEKVSSQAQETERAKGRAKHQPVHPASRTLPKDYPVRLILAHCTACFILTQLFAQSRGTMLYSHFPNLVLS